MSKYINAGYEFGFAQIRLQEAAQILVDAMETCHICSGTLLVDDGPAHCENCSGDCDDHDLPNCRSIEYLHSKLKRALKGIV